MADLGVFNFIVLTAIVTTLGVTGVQRITGTDAQRNAVKLQTEVQLSPGRGGFDPYSTLTIRVRNPNGFSVDEVTVQCFRGLRVYRTIVFEANKGRLHSGGSFTIKERLEPLREAPTCLAHGFLPHERTRSVRS